MRSAIFVTVLLIQSGLAQAQTARFRSSYSGALIITPINTNIFFTPFQDFEPVLSGSIEYSFPRSDRLGYEFSAGYYPYWDHSEALMQFGIRRFFHSQAPAGGYWEWITQGGVSQGPNLTGNAEPLFGLGVRLGSVRTTRFGDFAFEYGGGPTLVLTGGETQLRANFFFGLGWMLGHEVNIER
ncbi:MAG: hypothetical protein Q8922_10835 [Bacteroidota bacterium]|nr:hypothetical protein [Bacteroidota bacterium]MDP4232659.1 hypothetical protein [Bacteroidota bacterium]MDP4243208.1 hypothetical protein [Bacteroidota bacterium]MDP4288420.1 hypothetical protein [Bacteroidota bacterium]